MQAQHPQQPANNAAVCGLLRPLVIMAIFFPLLGSYSSALAQCHNRPASPRLPAGLKLTIRAEKPVAEYSRPVIVEIELSNESDRPISMRDNLIADLDYELHARDANGKEPPLTEWGDHLRNHWRGGSGNDMTLAPGEKYSTKEDLSKIYEISVVGDYAVEACRELYDWGNIYSNKIVIPFIAPPPKLK